MDSAPLLRVESLTKHYPVRRGLFQRTVGFVRALDGVSLSLEKGRTLGLVGESGSGKTTLGRAILRLIEPSSGKVTLDGQELTGLGPPQLREARRRAQMVFQDPQSFLSPRMSVGEIVSEPLRLLGGLSRAAALEKAATLLREVGLPEVALSRRPPSLSGGQKQRVGIARALALSPELLVADEPVSALDVSVRGQILDLLARIQAERRLALLLIGHDLRAVGSLAHRIAVMYLGRVVEEASPRALFARPRHPYSEMLLASLPAADLARAKTDRQGATRPAAWGNDPPDPADPPSGCRFRTRCPYAEPICAEKDPPLLQVGEQTSACHFAETLTLKGVA